MKVIFLSSNPGKVEAALYAFGEHGIELVPTPSSIPEIQADRSVEIARFAAEYHAKEFGLPVVREDHALYINALGIPGPYASFVERRLSARRLSELLQHQTDRSGYFEIGTALALPDGRGVHELTARVDIEILSRPAALREHKSWSSLLAFPGDSRSFAEYPEKERLETWSANLRALAPKVVSFYNTQLYRHANAEFTTSLLKR